MAARGHTDCLCNRPLGLEWGDDVPLGIFLCELRFHFKFNGLTWFIEIDVCKVLRRTRRGYLWILCAAGIARKRYRRLPIHMCFIPTCEGGTRINARLGDKAFQTSVSADPPASFVAYGRKGVTITPVYAQHVRARQPIVRGKRLLMTQSDRAVLLLIVMCLRRGHLPREMRDFVLGFLNMSDFAYISD